MKKKAASGITLTLLLLGVLSLTSNVALIEPYVEVIFRGGQCTV